MQIPDYNNYSYSGTQTFTIKATKTHLLQHGPKFIITLDSNWWPELISSCGDVFESIDSIKAGSSCVVNTLDTKELFVYVANTSTIQIGDTFQLKSAAFNNNTFAATAAVPLFLEMSLSDATKHWHKDQGQNITAVTQHLAGLDTYFTIEYIYTLSGIQNFTFTGDSPFRTIKEYSVSAGNYTLIGIVSMNDSAGKVSLYQSMEDVTVALIPYPKARGLNASYPKMMQINLTSELCIDMDTGQRSEDLKYTWELYSDKSLSTLYLAWKSNLDHPIFLSNYFPVGVYYMKLIVTKWEYYSSWTWGVLNITTSDIMIELQSPNSLRSDQTTTFQSLVVSMEGDADFELVWLLTPPVYNRYQKANYLTIPAGTFCPGGIYLLRCSLKSSQRLRYLNSDYEIPNIEITLNIPPSINVGSLIVNPMEGDGLDTQFSLTANHWLDPDLNPLTYKFSYTIIGLTSPTILSSWDHSNAITGVKLPHGKDVFHNIVEIKVEGRNSKNSTATIRKNITVNPIVIADKGAFADNLLSSATTAAEKLAAIASLTFLVEEDTDYAQPDACGGCHSQHGKCDSLVQSCICHDGYTASPLCNIPDTQLSQILNVSDLLATNLILNAEEALKTAEGAAGIFGTASNVLSNQIPLPTVAEKIENLIYSFLDKLELDESELESESKLELTEELVEGLMNTLGKIGGAMVVEERSESVIKDSERMKNRSEKYLSNLDKLTSTLISSLPPGTELNKDVGSFMVKGGKYAVEDISGKELESESSGSKVNMPEWNLGNDSSSIIQYKYLVFNNNPRTNIFNQTIGTTQGFNLYSSKSKDKIIAQNLSHPIIFQFTMIGLTNETLSKLKCSFFNSTLANYSTNGMTTLSKTIRPDGTILIKCQSTHLSEFAVATNPADDFTTDAKSIVDNNNLDAVAEFDNIDQVNVAESIPLWLIIIISIIMITLIITIGVRDYRKKRKVGKEPYSGSEMLSQNTNEINVNVGEGLEDFKNECSIVEVDEKEFPIARELQEKIYINSLEEQSNGKTLANPYFSKKYSYTLQTNYDNRKLTLETSTRSLPVDRILNNKMPHNKKSIENELPQDINLPSTKRYAVGIQCESTRAMQKQNAIRTEGCCKVTGLTVIECHGITSPFIESDGGIPRRDKLLLLYLEIVIYMWASAIFFDSAGGEELEEQMSAVGIILLSLAVIIISIPPILLVGKLLKRPPFPKNFINKEGDSSWEVEKKISKWRRIQCLWTILGYVTGFGFIVFLSIYILVLSIIMGKDTTDLWLKTLLVTFIIDYILMQPAKGIILICCLSEGCVDFMLTFFAGNLF